MSVTTRSALNAYAKVGVETGLEGASPHKLISMLFDGAIVAVAAAKGHMQRKDVGAKGAAISKAIAIIDEGLSLSLDVEAGGELAQNLKALYGYMCQRLLVANLKDEILPLDEVSGLLVDLKGAWDAIDKSGTKEQEPIEASKPEHRPERSTISYGKA